MLHPPGNELRLLAFNPRRCCTIITICTFFFSYLELLGTFRKLVGMKKTELSTARNRTKVGLDKVGVIAPLLQAILGSRLRINFRMSFRVFKEKRSSMKAFTVLFFIC